MTDDREPFREARECLATRTLGITPHTCLLEPGHEGDHQWTPNRDDRAEFQAARAAGLKARQERRLENATYTAAEVKVLTEAALRLGRKEALEEVKRAFEPTLYASDDGTEFEHSHPVDEGEPECPACWVQHIRQILGINLPPKSERPLHVMSCDDCRADLDVRDHYPDCSQLYSDRPEPSGYSDLSQDSRGPQVLHKPFDDDGVTYCGWATGTQIVDGCGEVWPCSTVRNQSAPPPLSEQDAVHEDLRQILLALGLGDQARPYSSHEVVQREVLPAIRRLVPKAGPS